MDRVLQTRACGKCTPCREGTWWLVQILTQLEAGQGKPGDIEQLLDLCDNILGRTFCTLGDGATSPITSAIAYFRRVQSSHAHPCLGTVPLPTQHRLDHLSSTHSADHQHPTSPPRIPSGHK